MPSQNLLLSVGGHDTKDSCYAAIFTNRYFTGPWTNRKQLRASTGVIYENYYNLGGTDARIDGVNATLSSRLTLVPRPDLNFHIGNIRFSPACYYSFHKNTVAIRPVIDPTVAGVGGTMRSGVVVKYSEYGRRAHGRDW
jgi:hypothetical protein